LLPLHKIFSSGRVAWRERTRSVPDMDQKYYEEIAMIGYTKNDLPYIDSKSLFAAVMYAGWLMGQNHGSIALASKRAAERFDVDEKAVAFLVQAARIRASSRQRVSAV